MKPFLITYRSPILFFLVGAAFAASPYFVSNHIPGDIGDARFNQFVLEHFYRCIITQDCRFADLPCFYPWPKTVFFSDTHWGSAWIYSIFRFLSISPEKSFAYWFSLAFLLNYLSCYISLRCFTISRLGASLGAFLFTFSLPVIAQDGHAQLAYRMFIPAAIASLSSAFRYENITLLCYSALFAAFQFLLSPYLGYFLFIFCLILLIIYLYSANSQRLLFQALYSGLRQHKLAVFLTLAVTAAAFALFFLPYHDAQQLYAIHRPWPAVQQQLPRLESLLLGDRSRIWPSSSWFPNIPMRHEQQMFIGIGAALLIAGYLFATRFAKSDRASRIHLVAAILFFVSVLSWHDHSLYNFLQHVSGVDAIQSVCRCIFVLLFPLALLLAKALDYCCVANKPSFPLIACGCVCTILCISDSIAASKVYTLQGDWEARLDFVSAHQIKALPTGAVVAYADRLRSSIIEQDVIQFAQRAGVKTLNGYSGNCPPNWVIVRDPDDVEAVISASERFYLAKLGERVIVNRNNIVFLNFSARDIGAGDFQPRAGGEIDFRDQKSGSFLISGFSSIEKGGVWTDGPYSRLRIGLTKWGDRNNLRLTLIGQAYVPKRTKMQQLSVSVNGGPKKIFELTAGETVRLTTRAEFSDYLQYARFLIVDIDILYPTSPKADGVNEDSRKLGFALGAVEVEPIVR